MTVRYIYNSAALGGPQPMEITGKVFHQDHGRITIVSKNNGTAYLHREAIFEADEA